MKKLLMVLLVTSLSTQVFSQQRNMDFNQWKVFLESLDGRVRTDDEVMRAMNFYNTHYDMNGKPISKKTRDRMISSSSLPVTSKTNLRTNNHVGSAGALYHIGKPLSKDMKGSFSQSYALSIYYDGLDWGGFEVGYGASLGSSLMTMDYDNISGGYGSTYYFGGVNYYVTDNIFLIGGVQYSENIGIDDKFNTYVDNKTTPYVGFGGSVELFPYFIGRAQVMVGQTLSIGFGVGYSVF